MTNHSTANVQKLWNYCNMPRDDGLSYGDFAEQQQIVAELDCDCRWWTNWKRR